MYGTQTLQIASTSNTQFENDVKMYGTQTYSKLGSETSLFENDVKMYGTQTLFSITPTEQGLRMM